MTDIVWQNCIVRLGDLKPWADNPRTSSKAQAKRILKSFEQFGQAALICIDPESNVLDGHQRLSALLTVHGPDYAIEARRASRPLSDDERRALVLALANATGSWEWQSLSGWNVDTLKEWGFDAETLKGWNNDTNNLKEFLKSEAPPATDAEVSEDRAAELLEKWQVKTGDLWQIGEHRLICGDCTDAATVARVMEGEKAKFSVTSPPYPGAEMWETEGEKLVKIGSDCLLIMRDVIEQGAAIAWNTSDVPCGQAGVQPNPSRDTMTALSIGWVKRAEIVWEKGLSYLPAPWNTRRPTVPNSTHELILIFYNGERVPREKEGNLNETELLWNRESVWKISPAKASKENHIAPFPSELSERCISLFTYEGDLVYEPFSGSGTTLVACQNLNRRCRAIEISPAYVAVALQRMQDAFPGIDILRLSSDGASATDAGG